MAPALRVPTHRPINGDQRPVTPLITEVQRCHTTGISRHGHDKAGLAYQHVSASRRRAKGGSPGSAAFLPPVLSLWELARSRKTDNSISNTHHSADSAAP